MKNTKIFINKKISEKEHGKKLRKRGMEERELLRARKQEETAVAVAAVAAVTEGSKWAVESGAAMTTEPPNGGRN